ncbi:hypothetical protein M3936_04390 [Sutcliffiella horikoshii]|uniref:hypothetical protein n=1 Tax=Sutcliffiella horikoshii TaxID=79883 RepID=UPI00203C62C1|nr:hypothetical protein [Sutcliffiella horikoshii]MCM3616817.1 hypothetical protein [Sutcliffiella horikoshii]
MSFYYEYKGCCGHKKVEVAAAAEPRLDCFCSRFLQRFLGDTVTLRLIAGDDLEDVTIACIDRETGIVTVTNADGTLTYVCCRNIIAVLPETTA